MHVKCTEGMTIDIIRVDKVGHQFALGCAWVGRARARAVRPCATAITPGTGEDTGGAGRRRRSAESQEVNHNKLQHVWPVAPLAPLAVRAARCRAAAGRALVGVSPPSRALACARAVGS